MRRAGDVRLSVIVPVYNLEAWLPATLASLLEIGGSASGDGSRGLAVEIIAVDDGSTDGSLEVLRGYAARHPEIRVIAQANGGVSRARNAGIEAARGTYLAFVDGDDTVVPGFYRDAVREMDEGGWDLVQGNTLYVEDGGRVLMTLPGSGFIPGGRLETADFAEQMELFFGRSETLMFSSCAKVFRRSSIGEVRFPEGIRVAEDQGFMFEFLRKGAKVLILDRDAYSYFMRGSSATHDGYEEKGRDAIRVLEKCGAETESPRVRRQIEKRKTDVWVRMYNTAVLAGKDPGEVLQAIRRVDAGAIRGELTGKEYGKLMLLQKAPGIYNLLLKRVKG